MARRVQRSYKYRWYPTDEQAAELTRTFGCVRLIYNKALEARSQAAGLQESGEGQDQGREGACPDC